VIRDAVVEGGKSVAIEGAQELDAVEDEGVTLEEEQSIPEAEVTRKEGRQEVRHFV
jgi:hypothetical protein